MPPKSSTKKPSSTKKRAATAKAAARGTRSATASEKAAASTKAAASVADIRGALEVFMRRLRKPRIAKVAAEMVEYIASAGPNLAEAAQEVGVLQKAAKIGERALLTALLDAGVDPNTDAEDDPGADRALAAIFDEWEIDDDKALALVNLLLARGAKPDHLNRDSPRLITNVRRASALDAAAKRRAMRCVNELAKVSSATTRSHALNAMLEENYHMVADEERSAMLERLIELADLDIPDHDGVYPLHAAALRGDAALFRRLYAAARIKLPRLARATWTTLHLAVPAAGGTYPTVMYADGASPLYVARLVRARLAQTVADYGRPEVDARKRDQYLPFIENVVAGCEAIISFLEGQGHVDDTKAAPLPAPLETVRAACSQLATRLGIATFDERAALIDSTKTGAFGYFLECAKLIRPELDDAARATLEQHLVGKFITGTVARNMRLRDEVDELDETFGPDPDAYCVWPENYPAELRELLESAAHYGVNGDAVLALEAREGDTTKLWEISPTAGIDHGPVDAWVKASIATMIGA